MKNRTLASRKLKWLALPLAFLMLLTLGLSSVFAGNVTIRDDADLLSSSDESSLRQTGSAYGFDLTIVTTNNSYSSQNSFASYVRGISNNSKNITIGIGARNGYTVVETGTSTGINSTRASQIAGSANSAFASKNFRAGLETIIGQLGSATTLGRSGSTSSSGSTSTSSGGGSGFLIGLLVIGVLVAIVVVSVILSKQRRRNAAQMQPGVPIGGYAQPGYDPNYQQGYAPGYGPNYGPGYGYGPGYYDNRGSGIGSALGGAAIGGLAGYAIGSAMNNNNPGYYSDPAAGVGGATWDAGGSGGEGVGGASWDVGGGDSGGSGGSDWGGGGGDSGGGFDSGGEW